MSAQALQSPAPAGLSVRRVDLPAIGQRLFEGTYAGLTLHDNVPMALIVLDGDVEDKKHQAAVGWAREQGGELPSRIDALVLFKNVPAEFLKEIYWTAETHASDADFAWYQDFSNGTQYHWRKGNELRARAVRRIVID